MLCSHLNQILFDLFRPSRFFSIFKTESVVDIHDLETYTHLKRESAKILSCAYFPNLLYVAVLYKPKVVHVVNVNRVVALWEWKRRRNTATLVTLDFDYDVDSGFARRSQTVGC
jgi:hypothetical protein